MPEDVVQRLVEMLGRVRPTDIVRVERQAHHASVLGTLAVEVLSHQCKVSSEPQSPSTHVRSGAYGAPAFPMACDIRDGAALRRSGIIISWERKLGCRPRN
jgi:hypothetical protein